MKEDKLRKLATCGVCGKKLMACGMVVFYTVEVKQMIFDMKALSRQQGLGLMIGHGGLAQIMGANEDMAQEINSLEFSVCGECQLKPLDGVAVLIAEKEGE